MKNIRKNKNLIITMILSLLLMIQLFFVLDVNKKVISAESTTDIITNIEISNDKDSYRPGNLIRLKVDWELPNDDDKKSYSPGDQFKISIPEGLSIKPGDIEGGLYSDISIDDSFVTVTFTDLIDGKVDRHGRFFIDLIVDDIEEDTKENIDIIIKDGNNNIIKNFGKKEIDNKEIDIDQEDTSSEIFTKGAYSFTEDRAKSGDMRWWIRVNRAHDVQLSNKNFLLEDRLDNNQMYLKETFEIQETTKDGTVNVYYYNQIINSERFTLQFSDDLREFSLKLDTEDDQAYNIEYETVFIGNKDDFTEDQIELKNKATLVEDELGPIPMDDKDDNIATGIFDLKGWSLAKDKLGKLELKKVDALTSEPLAGVEFKIKSVYDNTFVRRKSTNEEGIAIFDELPPGPYEIVEVKGLDNYNTDIKKSIYILPNKTHAVEIENSRKPIDLKVVKKWQGISDNKYYDIDLPPFGVTFQLYADGSLIRSKFLPVGEKQAYTFKNLEEYKFIDGELHKIKYELKEIPIEGFITEVNPSEQGFEVINKEEPRTPSKNPAKVDLKGKKVWKDHNNEDISPQASITIDLYANGELLEDKRIVLDVTETEFEFKNLPKFNDEGKKIHYDVKESPMPGYEVSLERNIDGFDWVLVNKKKDDSHSAYVDVSLEKVWKDQNEKIIEPLTDICFTLYADGIEVDKYELKKDDPQEIVIRDLPKYNDTGQEIDYVFEEENSDQYQIKVVRDGNHFEFINILKENETKPPTPIKEETVTKEPVTKEPTIPNTGIKLTYAPYLLILMLALLILVIGSFKKFKDLNK